MAKKKKPKADITCADCIHECACSRWNVGNIHNMDATNCNARETVRESNAYDIGYMDGQKDEPERGVHGFGSSGR